ncbi:ABC transporter substrate-binding protein [Pyrococcus abyssi]|nr:ABC transporter substrate-binding protein [Pyrococcus abyssi]CCE70346.1 TPA: oligopeptide-binding protein appa precursor [Pyrococcus abyssi GE5]
MKKLVAAIVVGLFILSISAQHYVVAGEIQLPRNETLYVGGGLWSQPNNFNPTVSWAAVTGTIGLIYETLFIYDPLKDKLEPWLAESGKWISDNTYRVVLKEGLTWQDGKPLTAEDVKFTFDYAKEHKGLSYSPIWGWLKEVKVVDNRTVDFIFSEPHYEEWKYWLYNIAIIPEHIWKNIDKPESFANTENPIGSGMYKLYKTDQMRFILVRNDKWWGIKYYGKPAPKYIVYVIVYSNNLALSMLVKGDLDWSNFFIPGVPDVKAKYGIVTWYDKQPYHLPINTAFLFLNTQKPPLNNPMFRRAIAYAINPKEIAARASQNQVKPADPTGLLIDYPVFKKIYYPEAVKKYGFTYDPAKANEILDQLGYKDINGDGYRETPDGKPLKFTIEVPYGWTDWMEMARVISEQLQMVGIRVDPKFPDYGKYWDDLTKGNFDMIINNFGSQVYATPWQWFNWVFYPDVAPIGKPTYSGNWGRYKNERVAELLRLINTEKDENKKIQYYHELQEIFLKDLPYIPLIYNGAWFEASTQYWTNWPTEHNPYALPITWQNYWQMGGLKVLLNIKPAKATTTSSPTTTPTKTTSSPTSTPTPTQTPSTSSPTATSTSPTETTTKGGICGPALLVGIAVVPILLRKRRK